MNTITKQKPKRKSIVESNVGALLSPLLFRCLISVCFVGMALSFYATEHTIQLQLQGLENPGACTVSEFINCDAAQASGHALLNGIPIAWWGFLFYFCLVTTFGWMRLKLQFTPTFTLFSAALSLAAVVFSLYKAYILFFVLQVLCPVCVIMYAVNFILLILLLQPVRHVINNPVLMIAGSKKNKNKSTAIILKQRRPLWLNHGLRYAAATAFIFVLGITVAKWFALNIIKLPEIDVAEEVKKHFQQPTYTDVAPSWAPVWGNPESAVEVVEFSDFQCNYCRHAAFHLRSILWEFKEEVKLRFMNFPLDPQINYSVGNTGHDQAALAARAVVWAQHKGVFWEFHDELFRNQQDINREFVLDLAVNHGWTRAEFDSLLEYKNAYYRVFDDIQYGIRVQVTATPTLLINGRKVKYWARPNVLRAIIEEEIRKANRQT